MATTLSLRSLCHWEVLKLLKVAGNGEALDGYEHGDSLSRSPWTLALLFRTGESHSVPASGAAIFLDGWGEEVVASSGAVPFIDVDSVGSVEIFSEDEPPLLAFCCSSSILCKYFACSSIRSCNCLCTWSISHTKGQNQKSPETSLMNSEFDKISGKFKVYLKYLIHMTK